MNELLEDSKYSIFRNYVMEDYPHLKIPYLQTIDFPVCLSEILDRLSSNAGVTCFYYIGDVFQQLILIANNCRQFNVNQPEILETCYQYEQTLLLLINDFIRKSDQKPTTFKTFADCQNLTLRFWPPGKVPPSVQSQKKKYRSPYREEVDALIYRFKKISSVRQGQLVAGLVQELENVKFNSAGQLLSQAVHVDFFQLKPTTFWWFYDSAIELYV